MFNEHNYIYKEKIQNLISLTSSKEKVEILHGKLFINNEIVNDKNKSLSIVIEIAYLLNIRIFKGVSKKNKFCKLRENKRGNAIELLWKDVVNGNLYPQYFNDTAIRKGVNKRDIGSSTNGLLYRTFVKLTGQTPKASRIPITKMLDLYTYAETQKFGIRDDEKIVNKTIRNVFIQSEIIENNLPSEYKNNVPFSALPMYVNRTKNTQSVHQNYTQCLHDKDPIDHILQGFEAKQNACEKTALKEISKRSTSNKVNKLSYIYDTEAEIEFD